MSTKIYFPSINAEAIVDADLKRGGTASVCDSWDGEAYFGRVRQVKFTTVRPAKWDGYFEIDALKHIPNGGFAYRVAV